MSGAFVCFTHIKIKLKIKRIIKFYKIKFQNAPLRLKCKLKILTIRCDMHSINVLHSDSIINKGN